METPRENKKKPNEKNLIMMQGNYVHVMQELTRGSLEGVGQAMLEGSTEKHYNTMLIRDIGACCFVLDKGTVEEVKNELQKGPVGVVEGEYHLSQGDEDGSIFTKFAIIELEQETQKDQKALRIVYLEDKTEAGEKNTVSGVSISYVRDDYRRDKNGKLLRDDRGNLQEIPDDEVPIEQRRCFPVLSIIRDAFAGHLEDRAVTVAMHPFLKREDISDDSTTPGDSNEILGLSLHSKKLQELLQRLINKQGLLNLNEFNALKARLMVNKNIDDAEFRRELINQLYDDYRAAFGGEIDVNLPKLSSDDFEDSVYVEKLNSIKQIVDRFIAKKYTDVSRAEAYITAQRIFNAVALKFRASILEIYLTADSDKKRNILPQLKVLAQSLRRKNITEDKTKLSVNSSKLEGSDASLVENEENKSDDEEEFSAISPLSGEEAELSGPETIPNQSSSMLMAPSKWIKKLEAWTDEEKEIEDAKKRLVKHGIPRKFYLLESLMVEEMDKLCGSSKDNILPAAPLTLKKASVLMKNLADLVDRPFDIEVIEACLMAIRSVDSYDSVSKIAAWSPILENFKKLILSNMLFYSGLTFIDPTYGESFNPNIEHLAKLIPVMEKCSREDYSGAIEQLDLIAKSDPIRNIYDFEGFKNQLEIKYYEKMQIQLGETLQDQAKVYEQYLEEIKTVCAQLDNIAQSEEELAMTRHVDEDSMLIAAEEAIEKRTAADFVLIQKQESTNWDLMTISAQKESLLRTLDLLKAKAVLYLVAKKIHESPVQDSKGNYKYKLLQEIREHRVLEEAIHILNENEPHTKEVQDMKYVGESLSKNTDEIHQTWGHNLMLLATAGLAIIGVLAAVPTVGLSVPIAIAGIGALSSLSLFGLGLSKHKSRVKPSEELNDELKDVSDKPSTGQKN